VASLLSDFSLITAIVAAIAAVAVVVVVVYLFLSELQFVDYIY